MMKNSNKFLRVIIIGMIMGVLIAGCTQEVPEKGPPPVVVDPADNAEVPNIKLWPTSRLYEPGATIKPLEVLAEVTDGGVLSYKWYKNTAFSKEGATEIEGETGPSYTVTQTNGDMSYYVVVTNTNENAKKNKISTVESNVACIRIQAGSATPLTKNITINANDRQQYVRGFGGMSSVAFRAGIGSASPDINVEELDILFNKNGKIRLNMFRIPLYDDLDAFVSNEIKGNGSFGDSNDNSDYYELVKVVNNNGGYVFACPWTPPARFKTNNNLVGGGHVKPELYGDLAQYFKDFLDKMADNGAPIYALSPQNEPNFTSSYEGCEYTPEEMRNFIKVLGPALAGTPGYGGGVPTPKIKIMTGESANVPTISDAALDDSVSAGYIDIIPRHYYGAVQVKYDKALNLGKEVWETEYSDTTGLANNLRVYTSTWSWVWQFLNWVDCSQRLNNESAFVWWYCKRFYGLIGDGQESGPPEKTITNRGYALGHYARFAVDTTRVGITTNGIDSINNTTFNDQSAVPKCTAYESMDKNSYSLIIFTPAVRVNGTGEGTGSVDLGDIKINLPEGFTATSAYALKTNINDKLVDELVFLSEDGKSAIITVPANTIISAKFSR
jgi:O-glycosyl hydrolase